MGQKITIYTKQGCPFCIRAKAFLDSKGADYQEIDVGDDPEKRQKLTDKSNGKKTVPQIFVGEHHIGGCDDLLELEAEGGFDKFLR